MVTDRADGVRVLRALTGALDAAAGEPLERRLAAAAASLCPALAVGCAIHLGDPPAPIATASAGADDAAGASHAEPLIARGQRLGELRLVGPVPVDDDLRAEAALRIATAIDTSRLLEQAETCRAYDDFLATLSHELRTPLSVVIGWIDLLQGDQLEPERRGRALEIVDRNARIQLRLIEDLLESARIASGNVRLDLAPVALADLVQAAVEAVRPQADAAGVALACRTEPGLEVRGDSLRLGQVVHNLVGNAIRYTPAGGAVEVQLGRADDAAVLVVSDTGAGIDPALLPHVFDRFRQGNRRRTAGPRGLGLGLYIVKHLVALHGGTVSAASDGPGQGARFTVTLPIAGP